MFKWPFSLFRWNLNNNYTNKCIIIIIFLFFLFFDYFYYDIIYYNQPNLIYKSANVDDNYFLRNIDENINWNVIYTLNFFYANFFSFNFVYLFHFYFRNFHNFVDLLYCIINNFFFDNSKNNFIFDLVYSNLVDYEYNIYLRSNYFIDSNPFDYYLYLYSSFSFKLQYYHIYLTNNFYKNMVYSFNLPIFFYFGLLFIFTTLSSLILLSYLGLYGVFILNLCSILLFWISTFMYLNVFFIDNIFYKINLGKWFIVNINYFIYFELFIDSISYSFMFLTLTIAVFVYIYAFSYFRYEPNVERFILLINCFVISMICLVTSGNFFVLFLGWELIGLTSFFLINFWSTRMSTLKSAFKAFTFNKFSDVSLLIGILIIFFISGDVSIINLNTQISNFNNFYVNILNYNVPIIEIISFFLINCAFVKSAQFGFHIWLPDSMEAPVPASALIHSATLVSAGVFILLRLSFFFEYSLFSFYIIPIIGSFTAFFGGLCSAYQSDIKKILAYSTISHCGFLMVCYSTYIAEYTVLYLYIHGFFKAAVFLCVGNIIRFSRNYQDFRRMGNFWKYLPFECFMTFICLINLCGLPFSIGFYIKHLLLIGYNLNFILVYFIYVNVFFGAISGLFYSYRLFYNVFFDFKKSKKIIYNQSNRFNLNSYYYSNTSLASNIAILGLVFFSYTISLYLFNIFLNSSSLGDGLNIYTINSSQYEEFNNLILTTINNISYFNWFLIIIILFIITISWRFNNNFYKIYNNYYFLLFFTIFYYFFFNIF